MNKAFLSPRLTPWATELLPLRGSNQPSLYLAAHITNYRSPNFPAASTLTNFLLKFGFKITPIPRDQKIGGSKSKFTATMICPLHDRVIIKRLDEEEQNLGGIVIPDTAKEKPQQGEVIAVGEGKFRKDGTRQTLDVKAGDRVLFGKYSGSEVKLDGEDYLILREDEILGVFTTAAKAKSAGK
jgi:chaperonin GroES